MKKVRFKALMKNMWKYLLVGGMIMAVMMLSMIFPGRVQAMEWDKPGWNLTFQDEFNGTTIDTNKWSPYYCDATGDYIAGNDPFAYCASNVSQSGGYLRIKAEKNPITINGTQVNYRTGSLQTRHKYYQKYGWFEARIKLPTSSGPIPAFWLMPHDNANGNHSFIGEGGDGAEIDIMEHIYSWSNYVKSNVHWGGYGSGHKEAGGLLNSVSNPTDWHNYAVEWDSTGYKFYVDGVLKSSYSGEGVATGSEYIILSMAIGGWGGTIDDSALPQEMLVDWVRAYQKAPGTIIEAESGTTNATVNSKLYASGKKAVCGMDNQGKYVTVTYNAPTAGEYALNIGYANGTGATAKRSLYINNSKIRDINLPNTGDWDTSNSWQKISAGTVSLNAGNNTIKIQTDSGSTNTSDFDYFEIIKISTKIEAESGTTNASVNGKLYASGLSAVCGMDNQGKYVAITYNAPEAGAYTLNICYANGTGSSAQRSLYINNTHIRDINLPNTGGWDSSTSWQKISAGTINLNAGNNIIKIQTDTGDLFTSDFDYFEIK